jgi:peptidoglycan/xylan/chitin deacetylase (PgdA/CDA1 family)
MAIPNGAVRRALGVAASVLAPLALAMQRRRDAGIVLLYHRVAPEDDPVYPPLSPEAFRAHCAFVRDHYDVLALSEVVERVRRGQSVRGVCAIAFDDGYRDFLIHALPILREFELHVTHFLVSDCLESGRPPWTYRVLRVAALPGATVSAAGLMSELRALPAEERERRLEEHERRLVCAPRLPAMLAPSDVARVDARLVEWGSHTRTHAYLDLVSNEEARLELSESKRRVEAATGAAIRYLAYPDGRAGERVTRLAQECGYEAAFAVGQSELRGCSPPHALPRFDVGGIPPRMLPLEISGTVETLRRLRGRARRLVPGREP